MDGYYDTWRTPFGPFSLAVDGRGAVTATAFGDFTILCSRLPGTKLLRDHTRVQAAREAFDAYFSGAARAIDVPVASAGSDYQRRVWSAMVGIPYGGTRTYGEIARELASSARAVGQASAANPTCVIVPCHRIVASDGSVAGYAFGADLKRRLLEHERRFSG